MQTSQDRWFLLGDLHGEAAPIDLFYWDNRDRLNLDDGNNHIILLGDVGANFGLKGLRDQRFKKALSQYPFTYICLRGNHEARVQNVINGNPRGWKQTPGKVIFKNLIHNRLGVAGFIVFVAILLFSFVGSQLVPMRANYTELTNGNLKPGTNYLKYPKELDNKEIAQIVSGVSYGAAIDTDGRGRVLLF